MKFIWISLESWTWHYVGESGNEVIGRNSHSMGILEVENPSHSLLVLFGGASPEHGPLADTFIAELPPIDTIGNKIFFFFPNKTLFHFYSFFLFVISSHNNNNNPISIVR